MSMIGWFRLVPRTTLVRLLDHPDEATTLVDSEDSDDTLCVDKQWHALHFLLTGSAWEGTPPLDFIARGGEELGDTAYGPIRAFDEVEIRAISSALERVEPDQLRARFDEERMAELKIYPAIWTRGIDEEADHLVDCFVRVRAFLMLGAEKGHGLLVYVT